MIGFDLHVRRKRFRSPATVALEDLRFAVAPGEFVAIVGPSGAGKTTLLNVVAGLDTEFDGELRLENSDPARREEAPRLGFVFQQPQLMPWLTVLDNICLVLEESDEARERARSLLADVGLEDFDGAFPSQLSGGMQRRVALARSFVVRPDLLLMDEPFLSLDDPTAWRLRGQLIALWEECRPTVLYVTHDLREALTVADRVLFLSERPGRVILDHAIEIARPRGSMDPRVAELHQQLLAEHPDLLSGQTGGGDRRIAGDAAIESNPRPRVLP